MEWYQKRRQIDSPGTLLPTQIIVSHAAKKIQELITWQARRYHIVAANDTVYEVFSLENTKNYIVKLEHMTCTCVVREKGQGEEKNLAKNQSIWH